MDSPHHSFPETAADGPSDPPDSAPSSSPLNDFEFAATDLELTEDQALALLQRQDYPAESIEQLAANTAITKSRKVRRAIASHPRTPRHISLRLIREFYTLDLMQFALSSTAAPDLKRGADEMLVKRIASITFGERISLARRASPAVTAALLLDKESRVWQTALANSRLTEAAIVKTLVRSNVTAALVETLCSHPKWSKRLEIRIALLRNEKTPLARAIEFARTLPAVQLRDILRNSRLPEKIKNYLRKELAQRK
jgi:hypothetical protein